MRKLLLLALASPLIAGVPGDWYYFWVTGGQVFPEPPGMITLVGDPSNPTHCVSILQGWSPYVEIQFNVECYSIAKAYIDARTDVAGGAIDGACATPVDDDVWSESDDANYGEIDGGRYMALQYYEDFAYQDQQKCTAEAGCTITILKPGATQQECGQTGPPPVLQ